MQNQKTNDEQLYMRAKEAYYTGNPIMTDAEFDALEEKLKQQKDDITLNVGAWDRRAKIAHPTPMLSLSKIQADKQTGEPPVDEFDKWLEKTVEKIKKSEKFKSTAEWRQYIDIEYSQKLDGNAINVVYENGTVAHALSRGDGKTGRDYLPKLINTGQFPVTVDWNKDKYPILEFRCEAVIARETFDRKYAGKFDNERNYVAGILGSDTATDEQLSEIDLVPVEIRAIDKEGNFSYPLIELAAACGFKNACELKRYKCTVYAGKNVDKRNKKISFTMPQMFDNYCVNYKQDGKYRIDGMVVKIEEIWRSILGINEHDPNWGIAIKFKPEDCITEVTGFTFEMGKTGEFTPVALLKPVDLDGSTVSKASAYNANFIRSNNLNVGSLVSLVKSGDIIPQIINVINDSGEPYNIEAEERCPYCGSPLKVVDGTHIFCTNDNCEGIGLKKFINSMDALDVFGCGDAMCETLYYEVSDNPFYYLLCPKDILLYEMSIHGVMNKNMEKFVEEVKSKTSITLETVIAMMSYEGMSNGGKTIKEVAKKLAGLDCSFKGLEKSVVSGWNEGETKREEVESIVKELRSSGIEVVYPKENGNTVQNSGSTIRITMTGSPKSYGYATKAVFVKHLEELGYNVEEVDVKKCDILFTDDLSSTTGKMKTASELGKTIKEYIEM